MSAIVNATIAILPWPLLACSISALVPQIARAADVVCTPNPSGTAIASAAETCTGGGDKINYSLPATVTSTVTLTNVTIPGTALGTSDAVNINPGSNSITVLGSGGNITAVAGNGINITETTGNGIINLGTAANPFNTPIAGGNGVSTAQAVLINGRSAINVYIGNVPINGTSTGGGSWSYFLTQTQATAVNAPILLNSQGTQIANRGSIIVRQLGIDATDTVTVITSGAVTGLSGAGIQTGSINGNTVINASGPVIGSVGAGNTGISATITGTGNASVTTSNTVTGIGAARGLLVSSGAGGMNLSIGGNVTSAGANAIKTVNSTTTGTNIINLGTATVTAPGTGGIAVIDMTTPSGGLTTLNASAGSAINSNSATTAAQNGDLAIMGTGGSVVFNNAGMLRGIANFSAITVSTNSVTINNSGNWFTTGTSNFGAGTNVLNNSGTFLPSGTLTPVGLKTINNSGTIAMAGNGSADVLLVPTTAYISSGSARLSLDAPLGGGAQPNCAAAGIADCISIGASSGSGTVINVTDTATGPGQLNAAGMVLVHATSANAGDFVLGGSNVVTGQQGPVIPKGFVQYRLAFDSTNNNFLLVGMPGTAMMEVGYAKAGLQSAWQTSADSWADRSAKLRHANTASDWSLWVDGTYARLDRDNMQSFSLSGTSSVYDTSYQQSDGGMEAGLDTTLTDQNGSWVFGILAGYTSANLRFRADGGHESAAIWNIGGYASYFSNAFFADLLLKDDMARVNFAFPAAGAVPHVDGNAFGVKFSLGATLDAPDISAIIEPLASISYVSAGLDDLVDPSATFAFGNGDSTIGTIGARIHSTSMFGDETLSPFAFVGLNQEFSATNPLTITSGGQTVSWHDRPSQTFGTGSIGFSFHASDSFSGFLAADGLVSDRTTGWAVRAGLRQSL
jgi:outer membrane autotransporter protein